MTDENRRLRSETLLKAIQKEEKTKTRGKLRVFLGMCPGVGKTYAMLKAAQDLASEGKNVVVGLVETHDRKETADLLTGMNIINLKKVVYRGKSFEEMDLESILALDPKPDLVVVDELAHQNIPGARHLKRYQDIEELLAKGFNVYTTVNIQHIESRNDQVAQITGIIVKETVPDSFFDNADDIEVIDLSPQELLKRLSEGKVYLGERAKRAKENFFREERLTALRELALRFTAEKVDQILSQQMVLKGIEGPWNINEKLLVAVSSHPYSGRLIRAARRMAYTLDAPWVALHVDTGQQLNDKDKKNLELHLNLAKELGAEVIEVVDVNLEKAIGQVCKERNVTQVIMGRPERSFFKNFFKGGSLLDRLFLAYDSLDIHVLKTEKYTKPKKTRLSLPIFSTNIGAYFLTLMVTVGAALVFYAFLPYAGYNSLGSGFLIIIVLIAMFARQGPAIFAAAIFTLIWYFLFIPSGRQYLNNDYQTLQLQNTIMVVWFFITAIVASFLTSRISHQEKLMSKSESRSSLLYEFINKINATDKISEITDILNQTVMTVLPSYAVAVLADKNGSIETQIKDAAFSDKEIAVANWTFQADAKAGKFTKTLAGADCICYPISTESKVLGVLIIKPKENLKNLDSAEDSLINTLNKQAANYIQNINLAEASQKNQLMSAQSLVYSRMFGSLSTNFSPTVRKIQEMANLITDKNIDLKKVQADLTKTVSRLNVVLTNIGRMYSLENNKNILQPTKFKLTALLDEVLADVKSGEVNINIVKSVNIDIKADYKLLKSAFTNIINNSLQVSSKNIDISTSINQDEVVIKFQDDGPGIPPGHEKSIFERFYTANSDPNKVGLGLAIVKKVIDKHKGKVSVKNLNPGAVFCINLPIN